MIFVTVGTQLGFERLIDAMEDIAASGKERVIAQTGPVSSPKAASWRHIEYKAIMNPTEFAETFVAARLVVSHAGMGTVLSARKYGRPLILVPRRAALDEHRNDHQMATARALEGRVGINVAWEIDALAALVYRRDLAAPDCREGPEHRQLIARLKELIHS